MRFVSDVIMRHLGIKVEQKQPPERPVLPASKRTTGEACHTELNIHETRPKTVEDNQKQVPQSTVSDTFFSTLHWQDAADTICSDNTQNVTTIEVNDENITVHQDLQQSSHLQNVSPCQLTFSNKQILS